MFKMALKPDFKFAECLYLSNGSRKADVGPSTVYSYFCEGGAQQIPAQSGII